MPERPCPPCLNCGHATPKPARFCAHCGQRTDTARLSIADIVRDLMHTFVNVERGPLAFAWALLTGPGRVARDYVDGRRRRHYGPFATLVVIVGFTALAINLSGYPVLSHDLLTAGLATLMERHFNLLLLVQLPMLGGVCAALFRGDRLTLPEHMVLVAYTFSVRAVFIGLVAALAYALSLRAPGTASVVVFWGAWYLYFGWAASQFYAAPRWSAWLRGSAAAALEHAAIAGVLAGAGVVYNAVMVR